MADTMKLHWSPRSPYVRKVMIAAHELGLADRLRTVRTVVGGTMPHLEPDARQPAGQNSPRWCWQTARSSTTCR